jgi:ABC-type branched-subunit amino acid transport system substrate-binding protein
VSQQGRPHTSSGYRPGIRGVSQGVTDTTVTIGVVVLKNGDKFANGLGFSISFGDAEREFKAVIDDVNRHGGVAGRQIKPVIAYYDLGGAAVDAESLQASICSQFTEDRQVFAVLMPYNPLQSFVDCLAKRRTLLLNGSASSTDDVRVRQVAGWLYQPSIPTYSRYPRTLVAELQATGFFRNVPAAKAGILVLDSPDMVRAAERDMKPAIEAAGISVAAVTRISPESANSDINGAVLKFRSDGITHVFFVQAAGGIPLYFMQGADQQRYFPRYALSSFEVPGFFLQGQVPESQLVNASGIGWAPFFDLKAAELPPTPAERRCFGVIAKAGEQNAHRQSNLTSTPVCDLVWTFAAGARAAGHDLDFPSWRRGLQSLRATYASPVALRNDFSSGRSDAVAGYRFVSYVASCSCFRYTSPLKSGLR